ncbi:class I SAM-dependent methyltransferase [Sphingobium boeckii]|uniref:Class I SAM-dependent methyltransferase n=1 Tax=Sphingobium boeckii TaxID=1082345 RepID=A0A7W9AG17_9SPHN|nr:class I SAM-dependent methyltransferase [Sphingobium boeckii]MBB5684959.1 hypothetical protein [Sphingobium boeckii]
MTFGTFIDPDDRLKELADPNQKMGIPILGGYRAERDWDAYMGRSRIFDRIAHRLNQLDIPYEDQCSAKYYFDIVNALRDFNGEFNRVVEVGVFMGGASAILGGCVQAFDFDLDLVDIDDRCLHFAYERIRRTHPEAIGRVRMFHGDLPAYVSNILSHEPAQCIIHHDGDHQFSQVVKDMASLSYVAEKVHAIIVQDTHLRGHAKYMNFVDMALYAVFGLDLNYAPIGEAYGEHDFRTSPDQYHGNYFVAGSPEGFVLPMAMNEFRYPHPSMSLETLQQQAV